MTRLIGEHFKRDGSPKRRFATREKAVAFVDLKNQAGKVRVYYCKFCDGWHIATDRHAVAFARREADLRSLTSTPQQGSSDQ